MTDSRQSPPTSPTAAPTRRAENILGAEGLSGLRGKTSRRGFFPWLGLAWVSITAGFAMLAGVSLRFLFPNVLFEPPSTFKAGFPSEYEVGAVDERFKSKFGVWIVRDEATLFALSTICTHLGCTPNWLGGEQKFKCPCHGSGFYIDGMNFEGPAPRPLERYKIYVADDGQVVVDKNSKYQWEKGQWDNPESFVSMA